MGGGVRIIFCELPLTSYRTFRDAPLALEGVTDQLAQQGRVCTLSESTPSMNHSLTAEPFSETCGLRG